MQKHVNLVDLVKSFPTNIFLQNFASIQKRTSPVKFAHLAEKSEKGSISNLSTKAAAKRKAEFSKELQELVSDEKQKVAEMKSVEKEVKEKALLEVKLEKERLKLEKEALVLKEKQLA